MRGLLLVLRVFEGDEDGDDDDGVDESGDVHLVLHEERDDLVDGVVGDEVERGVGLGGEGLRESARGSERVGGGGVHDVEGLRRREREVVEERLADDDEKGCEVLPAKLPGSDIEFRELESGIAFDSSG